MRRVLLIAIALALCASPALARMDVNVYQLRVSGDRVVDYSLTSGVAVQSDAIRQKGNVGFTSLLVTEDIAGGAGDVDIYLEYSIDGTNWYRPYTTDMAGTITIEGNVVTALQNVTRWIVIDTPRMAPWVRVVFDPDADSEVEAYLIYQEAY